MLTREYVQSLGIERIINYLRRSRQDIELEKRTGEDTMKAQTDLMDRVLSPLGIPYDQRPELGSGDKISTRPVFQSVLDDLQAGKYQAIAVKEISRMGRGSYTDMGVIYDLLVEKRIYVITPYKVYDPANPADLRQIRFELFMSREEFETTRERLTGGRRTRAMEGRWMAGKPPYGYSIDPRTRKLVVKEDEAAVVRLLFDIYANGLEIDGELRDVRVRAIATYFTRIGIPTPKGGREWRPEILQYMLENDVYIGTVRYSKKKTVGKRAVLRPEHEHIVVYNAHEPIVELEIWNRVQEKLSMKDFRRIPRLRLDKQPYELTALVRCSCGSSMIRQHLVRSRTNRKGEVKTYIREYLWCKNVTCDGGAVNYQDVLDSIRRYLSYLGDLDDERLAKHMSQKVHVQANQTNREQAVQYIEKRRAELEQKLQFIYDQYEERFYDRSTFIARKKEVEKELERLNAIRTESAQETTNSVATEDVQSMRERLQTFQQVFDKVSRGQRNAILRSIFHDVIIKKTGKGTGRTKPTFDMIPRLKFKL
jgi:DNA invertase Pin-like site-specific DNA recombinase